MRWEWDGRVYENCVVFHRVDEVVDGVPVGGLSNMSGASPLTIGGVRARSTEALYQACRFPHQPDWQREILAAGNGMRAKMAAKKAGRRKLHSRSDWEAIQVEVMRWCLRVKLAQHYREFFVKLLARTEQRPIVERSRRDQFWGAMLEKDGVLRGANQLGGLLAELRDEALDLRAAGHEAGLLRVEPPAIPNFLLLGQPTGVVEADGGAARV
jgi:type I restriction enzyme, S subunit